MSNFCKHGNRVGGIGVDWICGACEDEVGGAMQDFKVNSLAEVIPLITTEFRIFHFPTEKATKPAMYGRMWKIRKMHIDAMVRQIDGEYVLITRKEYGYAYE